MKKSFIAFASALLLAASAFCAGNKEPESAPQLDFPGADKASVIDTSVLDKSQKFDDNVRFISGVDGKMTFTVRYFNPKKNEWVLFGSASTIGFADTAFVKSKSSIGKRRWIAVIPENGGDFKYTLNAFHSDLYIYVYPPKENVAAATKANAAIFDTTATAGKFNDNVAIVNKTSNPTEEWTVYGFNDKDGDWSKIGYAVFAGTNTDVTVNSPYEKSSIFKFVAIVPKSGKSYNYKTSKARNDFVIEANE